MIGHEQIENRFIANEIHCFNAFFVRPRRSSLHFRKCIRRNLITTRSSWNSWHIVHKEKHTHTQRSAHSTACGLSIILRQVRARVCTRKTVQILCHRSAASDVCARMRVWWSESTSNYVYIFASIKGLIRIKRNLWNRRLCWGVCFQWLCYVTQIYMCMTEKNTRTRNNKVYTTCIALPITSTSNDALCWSH